MSDAHQQSIKELVNQGTALLRQGKHAQAADLLVQAHAREPQDFDAAMNLSAAYILLKQYKRASPILEMLAKQESDNAMVWTNLGASYLGDPEIADEESQSKAVEAFTHALQLDPKAPNVAYNLGLIHKERKEFDVAAQWFEIALRTNPDDRDAQYWLDMMAQEPTDDAASAA